MISSCANLTIDTWICAEHYGRCQCPSLQADPDIAGIGVRSMPLKPGQMYDLSVADSRVYIGDRLTYGFNRPYRHCQILLYDLCNSPATQTHCQSNGRLGTSPVR